MTLTKIVSGGQTGADQMALQVAKNLGLATGGWMPKDFLTEAGPWPERAKAFGLKAMPTADMVARTYANVRDSDATLWIGPTGSTGFQCTARACREQEKPFYIIVRAADATGKAATLAHLGIKTLNVAGNRASKSPKIGVLVHECLTKMISAWRMIDARRKQPEEFL